MGRELARVLPGAGHDTVPLTRDDLDIADPSAVTRIMKEHGPDLIVNAAAFSGVDASETELEAAYSANALGPRNLAVGCERFGCDLLHVSTDYVFDGSLRRPYEPFDSPNPLNAYGRTKLAGEEYVKHFCNRWYIVRTAGVYGTGKNFVQTMLRLASEEANIKVKHDEYTSPTYALDLAHGITQLIEDTNYGVHHITNAGSCSWYEFACEILDLSNSNAEIIPVASSEYQLPATRPAKSELSNLGSPRLRHWREALAEYLCSSTQGRKRGL